MLALPLHHLSAFTAERRPATVRFERMVSELQLPLSTIEFIDSPKQRMLFRGIKAGAEDQLVYDAFSVVYQDLGPIKMAGDIIFNQLNQVAVQAAEKAAASGSVEALASLAASRQIFRLRDVDSSGTLDLEELEGAPELLALVREEWEDAAGLDDAAVAAKFIAQADINGDGGKQGDSVLLRMHERHGATAD